MAELVEYGQDDPKATAAKWAHIVRREGTKDNMHEERQIDGDCDLRERAGKCFVSI